MDILSYECSKNSQHFQKVSSNHSNFQQENSINTNGMYWRIAKRQPHNPACDCEITIQTSNTFDC